MNNAAKAKACLEEVLNVLDRRGFVLATDGTGFILVPEVELFAAGVRNLVPFKDAIRTARVVDREFVIEAIKNL